jgi:hypothetical protein
MRSQKQRAGAERGRGRSRRFLLLVPAISAFGVIGCVSDEENERRLSGACQVQRCVCAPGGWSPASASAGTAVLWRGDGSAYCPEGSQLHLKKPPPIRQ